MKIREKIILRGRNKWRKKKKVRYERYEITESEEEEEEEEEESGWMIEKKSKSKSNEANWKKEKRKKERKWNGRNLNKKRAESMVKEIKKWKICRRKHKDNEQQKAK